MDRLKRLPVVLLRKLAAIGLGLVMIGLWTGAVVGALVVLDALLLADHRRPAGSAPPGRHEPG